MSSLFNVLGTRRGNVCLIYPAGGMCEMWLDWSSLASKSMPWVTAVECISKLSPGIQIHAMVDGRRMYEKAFVSHS